MAKFTIQTSTKSHCGQCHGYLDLLCEDSLTKKSPTMFWICWPCKRVVQVGGDEVPREGNAPDQEDAIKWIRCVSEELVNAGFPAGDRNVALENIRKLIRLAIAP